MTSNPQINDPYANLAATIFEHRVVILMEDAPQSNCYSQIILTREQFSIISDAIRGQMETCTNEAHQHPPGTPCWSVPLRSDLGIKLDERIRSHYLPEVAEKLT